MKKKTASERRREIVAEQERLDRELAGLPPAAGPKIRKWVFKLSGGRKVTVHDVKKPTREEVEGLFRFDCQEGK